MRKELPPLKHIKEPKRFDKEKEGMCSEIFEFSPEKGKKYVYKEIGEDSWAMKRAIGLSPEQKAIFMKEVYEALKEHYGDKVIDTYYLISKNKEDRECIMIVQEKIDGIPLNELHPSDPRYDKALQQRNEVLADFSNFEQDSRWEKLPKVPDEVKLELDNERNIIVDKNGDIKIVDW